MTRYYNLIAVIDGDTKVFHKHFASRNDAIKYMFGYYDRNSFLNVQIEDEFEISKHNIEYVINYTNRFRVNRVVIA